MKRMILALFFILSSLNAKAAEEFAPELNLKADIDLDLNNFKIVDLYNAKKYNEANDELDKLASIRNSNVIWYYFKALTLLKLNKNSEAIENLEIYIKKIEATKAARAYYFLGLAQFNSREFEKALNSLELSVDVSQDANLDKFSEGLIEKTIRYREFYENHKRTNINFLLGYNYDTNVVSINSDILSEDLTGHILNYGLSASHRFIDNLDFIFEPFISFTDTYTLDSSFEATSTIQANDMLQFSIGLPIVFSNEKYNNTSFDLSVNAYTAYLPNSEGSRELYLNSTFIKAGATKQFSKKWSSAANLSLAYDKSYVYSSDDDDSSGFRTDLSVDLNQFLTPENNEVLNYQFSYGNKNTSGNSAKYYKYGTVVQYLRPGFFKTNAAFKIAYDYLKYIEQTIPRVDNKYSLSYLVSFTAEQQNTFGFSLNANFNKSNSELYSYSDISLGFLYTKAIGF